MYVELCFFLIVEIFILGEFFLVLFCIRFLEYFIDYGIIKVGIGYIC